MDDGGGGLLSLENERYAHMRDFAYFVRLQFVLCYTHSKKTQRSGWIKHGESGSRDLCL